MRTDEKLDEETVEMPACTVRIFTARPHRSAESRAVVARGIPSVRLSVTFRCFVQMDEDTIVRFSA